MIKITRLFLLVAALFFMVPDISAGATIYKNNVLTAKHTAIPGTHVAVVFPNGASLTSSFRGFEAPDFGIECRITEYINTPYSESAGLLTDKSLEADGIKIISKNNAVINNENATLLSCTKGTENKSGLLILAVGDKRMTSLFYGSFPLNDKRAEKALYDSIMSVIFQPQQKESNNGYYTLSTAGSTLKFASEANMTRYYTVGGKPVTNTVDDALFTCTIIMKDIKPNEYQTFLEATFANYMSQYEYKISARKTINYGGLNGFELNADMPGAKHRVRTSSGGIINKVMPGKSYQAMLFDNRAGIIYSFNGIAVRDSENYIGQFQRITASFKKTR